MDRLLRLLVKVLLTAAILANVAVSYADIFHYTQSQTDTTSIALGYPPPEPVDSLTPVDGFRSYASLHLRHQQLMEQYGLNQGFVVGQTGEGRDIWAYQLSDADPERFAGGLEPVALINGGIHAREWQSPEATTYLIEALMANSDNAHLEQYILENMDLVVLPVSNIDGFLQTQRFPSSVTNSRNIPRDGRMRRKNMAGVDHDLTTESDNLLGIDLNRNNNPYWATSNSSSSDPFELVYHGTAPASEPEIQALQNAMTLVDSNQMAFYMDTHSFTQLYFIHRIGQAATDNQMNRVATAMRAANAYRYAASPESAGFGIGTTGEYFAETYLVPSFTLEIEPTNNGGTQYGGNGVSHDGFILPSSEVARMRREVTAATLAGLYTMVDAPALLQMQILDTDGNALVQASWQATVGSRELTRDIVAEPEPGVSYQLRLVFNKPMRALNSEGEATAFSNLSSVPGMSIAWHSNINEQAVSLDLDVASGSWQTTDGQYQRYKTDTFLVPFQFEDTWQWQDLQGIALHIEASDMVASQLDSNPSSIAQWQSGAWQGYDQAIDDSGANLVVTVIEAPDPPEPPSTPPPTPAPPPAPEPPPTATPSNNGGGGGSGNLLIILLGLAMWRRMGRQRECRVNSGIGINSFI